MAYKSQQPLVLSMKAGEAMATPFVVVKLDTSNENQVLLPDATTDDPFGVIQDEATSGQSVPVAVDGVTKVVANGAFTTGDYLAIAATTGKVDTVSGLDSSFDWNSATAQKPIGVALETATEADQVVSMLIRPLYFPWA